VDLTTIKETATLFGLSVATLRRLDNVRGILAYGHPPNGYRCHSRADELKFQKQTQARRAP
jgi:DNA-binding transcriptional MerR regulator